MLLFGHIGLTLGATWGVQHALETKERHAGEATGGTAGDDHLHMSFARKVLLFVRRLDYRMVMAGSLVPDVIDKPLGIYIFRDNISNGRIFGHTLIFLVLTILAGLYLYKIRRMTWGMAIPIGVFTHLIFDQMWEAPRTLFWPLLGVAFERKDVNNWIPGILRELFADPEYYVPEIAGIIVLLFFTYVLIRKKKFRHFLNSGQVS